ncbi:MAG: YkvI family membrane protein [Lysobacterales bacterium]
MTSWFNRYLLPGFVFQSICIAGGYGTGRELAEFFLRFGPVGALLAIVPATVLMSIACMVAFELARMTQKYDYRSFLQILIGRGWFLYEFGYLFTIVLVLAVIGSATGHMMAETFHVPGLASTILLLAAVAFFAFKGTRAIEGFMSMWSFVLYAVYLALFLLSLDHFGPAIRNALATATPEPGWFLSGTRYGALQLALVPAILFATAHIKRRKEAFIAGALAGPILMIPGALLIFAMLAHYPDIMERPVPVNFILETLGSKVLMIVFPIVLIGTFMETGIGMIHALNERVANSMQSIGKSLPDYMRPVLAIAFIIGAMLLSRLGIIDLIAVGYSAMAWIFLGVLVIPLLTIGTWKVLNRTEG